MSIPPCVLVPLPTPNTVQTIVVKVSGIDRGLLYTFGEGQILSGAGSFGIVQLGTESCLYLVLTDDVPHKLVHRANGLKMAFSKLPGAAQLCWARAFTPRLQRLFGWGDAAATRAAVEEASKREDKSELLALIPGSAGLIERGDDVDFPRLFDALLQPMVAIQDCQHTFEVVGDPRTAAAHAGPRRGYVPDQCANGKPTYGEKPSHTGPWLRCGACNMALCLKCARALEEEQEERKDLDKAVQEVRSFKPAPELDEFRTLSVWLQHPERPLPFFVINPKNLSEEERLAWVKQELGKAEVDLEDFARKFVSIFGVAPNRQTYQKALCIRLFAQYQAEPVGWKLECDLPPCELERFQRVWNPKAPGRCLECSTKLEVGTKGDYCDEACRNARMIIGACVECGCKEMVPSKAPGWERCAHCSVVVTMVLPVKRRGESLNEVTFRSGGSTRDPTQEPAWKSRRRS